MTAGEGEGEYFQIVDLPMTLDLLQAPEPTVQEFDLHKDRYIGVGDIRAGFNTEAAAKYRAFRVKRRAGEHGNLEGVGLVVVEGAPASTEKVVNVLKEAVDRDGCATVSSFISGVTAEGRPTSPGDAGDVQLILVDEVEGVRRVHKVNRGKSTLNRIEVQINGDLANVDLREVVGENSTVPKGWKAADVLQSKVATTVFIEGDTTNAGLLVGGMQTVENGAYRTAKITDSPSPTSTESTMSIVGRADKLGSPLHIMEVTERATKRLELSGRKAAVITIR